MGTQCVPGEVMRMFWADPVHRLKVLLAAVGAGVLILGLLAYGVLPGGPGETAHPGGQPAAPGDTVVAVPGAAGLGAEAIAAIVARTSPAVVKIETVWQGRNPLSNDPFFGQFFGSNSPFAAQVEEGIGSGFIISGDGYILTNDHVVHGAKTITVAVAGRPKPYSARVVGANYSLDLALVKIDAGDDLPVLTLGDSRRSRVGDWVIAIGNPYGLDHTVTVGVLSAKGRPITAGGREYSNLLQTDASINPGNSGGPLLNLAGQVIGINTAVTTQAQGIGFAIPSSTVEPVLNNWIHHAPAVFLGVTVSDVPARLAASLNLAPGEGAYVVAVAKRSAAGRAGLKAGDVIWAFDGQPVKGPDDLLARIQGARPGTVVRLTILRGRARLSVRAVPGRK